MMQPILSAQLPIAQGSLPGAVQPKAYLPNAVNLTSKDFFNILSDRRMPQHKNFLFFTPVLLSIFSLIQITGTDSLKDAMAKGMNLNGMSQKDWHEGLCEWIQTLCKTNDFFKMQFGTMMMTRYPAAQRVLSDVEPYAPEKVNFTESEQAKTIANDWVKKKTDGKIPQLLNDVPSKLAYMLLSAATMDCFWSDPFNPAKTERDRFYNLDGTTSIINMMKKEETAKLARINEMEVMEKPYKGNLSMFFIKPEFVPYNSINRQAVDKQLKQFMQSDAILGMLAHPEWFHEMRDLEISIPKIEIKDRCDYKEELKDTEMGKALEETDFRGFFEKDPGETVRLAFIQSEVKFQMDENGVSIGAAAAGGFRYECCRPSFDLNCPFAMMMVDRLSNTVVAMGQVLKLESLKK